MTLRSLVLALCLIDVAAGSWAQGAEPDAKALVMASREAMRNDPDRSRALAQQALDQLAHQPDADLSVEAHWLLCDFYAERDQRVARQHLLAGRAMLGATTQPALAAQLLGCEGDLNELAGQNGQAMALYDESVALAERSHNEEVLANALYQRGYLRGVRGELAAGLADIRRSNELFEHLKLPAQALNTLSAAATLYDRMGDHLQARQYFEDALDAQRRLGLVREQAVTLHNLGRAQESLGDLPAARASFEAALALSRRLDYTRGLAYALRGLASVENDLGHPDAALTHLDQASALLDSIPDERLHALVDLQRGISLRLLGRPVPSVAALTAAQRVLEHADSQAELTTVYGELASSYAAQGDYRSAYDLAQRFKRSSETLLRRQLDERFAVVKVEFATAVTDRENQALKRANQASEHALAQEQQAGTARAVALVLAVVLLAVLTTLLLRHRRTTTQMRGLAMTDELTQWPNRRHILGRLRELLSEQTPCSIFIADLDLFKAVNDEHGHLIGDEVLRAVSARMREHLPIGAEAGRMGGEEFIVLLPEDDLEAALGVAERVRVAVEALDVSTWLPDRGITISIGVTECARGDGLGAVLRRADAALYAAKRDGRNRVRSSPGDHDPRSLRSLGGALPPPGG